MRLVGCPNESHGLTIIYYLFKYTFSIKTSLLVLLRSRKSIQKLDFGKTSYNHFGLGQSEFLRLFGAPNEFLRLIIIYYLVKYLFVIKTTLLDAQEAKKKTF